MRKHEKRREPRAHWLLLGLFLLVLLGELGLHAYIAHIGDEGVGQQTTAAGAGTAPAAVTDGGPVQRIAPNGAVTTRTLPPRTIAFTFDDGPDPQWTPQILDLLTRYGAHATFFEIGSRVNEYPQLTRRIVAQGSEVGQHTFTHVDMQATPAWRRSVEITLAGNAIAAATGRMPVLFRPPYSSEPDAVTARDFAALRQVGQSGYLTVLADLDTQDWNRPGVAAIVAAATPHSGTSAVVMMHDSGGDRSQTVAALAILLPRLSHAGYRFTTISEALRLPPAPPAPIYVRMRGEALRIAQIGSDWVVRLMTILLALAIALSGLRLAIQLFCARRHVRGLARRPPRRQYLGAVSVIVPAYNESANIAATVRSLVASDYPRLEVIVVDDGSTDGTGEIVRSLGVRGVYVLRQPNAGKPAALNNGIAHARGDLLVMADGDTVFEPDAIGQLVQPFADPEVGAVAGNTKVANRRGLLGRWQHLEYVVGCNLDRRVFDVAECMPTVPGAIGAFRREAVRDAGGISTQTLAEDTDFTMAVVRAGWRVVYEPNAVAWTEVPGTIRQLWRQRYRWCYGTMQSMWKHRRSVVEGRSSGRLGRRGLAYLLMFQVLLPLASPAVDVYALGGLLFLPLTRVLAVWAGFTVAQMLAAAYALWLDRERLGPLWTIPLQQIVYRQMMYLVVIQSTVMALTGGRLRWHRLVRTGAATAHAGQV